MTANLLAPARYRAGKPVGNIEPSDSESEDSDSEAEALSKPAAPAPKTTSFPSINVQAIKQSLAAPRPAAQEDALADPALEGFETASDSEDSETELDSDDDQNGVKDIESSDDSDSSQDAAPKFAAPVFLSKSKRAAQSTTAAISHDEETEQRQRQEKADAMLQAQIEREARQRNESRKAWDDDDDAILDEVDDTDDLDPETERAAWVLRELTRVKRDREALVATEKQLEETERRNALTPAERAAEDEAHIAAQRDQQGERAKIGFMQRYHHRGAFFQGEGGEAEELARQRDLMGVAYADEAADREALPKYMQIRDMTKLGKKGRTRYKDLKNEDTGRWGDDLNRDRRDGASDGYGARHAGPAGATGANNYAVGERRPRDANDDRSGADKRSRNG